MHFFEGIAISDQHPTPRKFQGAGIDFRQRWSPEIGQCVKVDSLNLTKEDHPHE